MSRTLAYNLEVDLKIKQAHNSILRISMDNGFQVYDLTTIVNTSQKILV